MRPVLVLLLATLVFAELVATGGNATGYRGYTAAVDATPPVALTADVQILPTPFWQEWILGNYTAAFQIMQGCVIRGGLLRYGIAAGGNIGYVETPSVTLGQNFTVVVVFRPRAERGDSGYIWLWRKEGSAWYGEMSATFEHGPTGSYFRIRDTGGNERAVSVLSQVLSSYVVLAHTGYLRSDGTYVMEVYINGQRASSTSFAGQRFVSSSVFRLGAQGGGVQPQVYFVAFAVYNRTLSASEIASFSAQLPVFAVSNAVMFYYADPMYVRDMDGDGRLEWIDLSGNNRHAKLYGAFPTWFVSDTAYVAQRCGQVKLYAEWDGFTARYNNTASLPAPGFIAFDGRTSYAVIQLTVYGWGGITVEQYVYVSPLQKAARLNKFTSLGAWWSGVAGTGFICSTPYSTFISNFGCTFYTRVDDPVSGTMKSYGASVPSGRWVHVVMTYDVATRRLVWYIDGSVATSYTIPPGEYTVLETDPNIGAHMRRLVLGLNSQLSTEFAQVAYAYVRVYSRALTADEIRHNMQSPYSPVTEGLEVWVTWRLLNSTHLADLSGRGRHARVVGNYFVYPATRWTVGAYLAMPPYPAASPLVLRSLSVSSASFDFVAWQSSGVWQNRGGWVRAYRVDGAYVDAAAGATPYAQSFYVSPNATAGFTARWTPSDDFRGWISIWQFGNAWLNITQVGGHGVAAPGVSARAHSGVVAARFGDGLYINGTRTAVLTQASASTSFVLLPGATGGVRALLTQAWLDAGVRYGVNSSSTYGSYYGTAYTPGVSPSPWAYYVDFTLWPPVATWGVLNDPLPPPAVRVRTPGGVELKPYVLSAAILSSSAVWTPFGELCLAGNAAYGARHVWLGGTPSCILPGVSYLNMGTSTVASFSSTAPVSLIFNEPPVQHPLLANSVPGARFCSLDSSHFAMPYLPVRAPGSTLVTDSWACAPTDYASVGHVATVTPGWALIAPVMRVFKLNTTSVIYFGSGAAVLAHGGTVPAMSARAKSGESWHIYVEGGVVRTSKQLSAPPNVPKTSPLISGMFGVSRSASTLVSQWWSDGTRYYVQAAGLADSPVVYISAFSGSPLAVTAELNAPADVYTFGVLQNGVYHWALPLPGPQTFALYVPLAGYYTARLYRGEEKVWEKEVYLSPETKLVVGPLELAQFMPARPISLREPVAPIPPVIVPAVSISMPAYGVAVLILAVFAAMYVTFREVSLAAIAAGGTAAVLYVLIPSPLLGVVGGFLMVFGVWNKMRRQSS